MKHSSIFMQAFCLATLMIMASGGRLPLKKLCLPARINIENKNLMNKTADFIKLFPDKNTSIKLLTYALKDDFMKNCSTRHSLLSFYAENVLSSGRILAEAKKRGIDHDFMRIEDLLHSCPPSKCELSEETQNMKELKEKFDGNKNVKVIKILNKAVSEFDILLLWIHEFTYHGMKNKTS